MDNLLAIVRSQLTVPVRQFIKFSIVGAGNATVDFVIYTSLTRGSLFFHQYYLAANAVSWFVAVGISFMSNKFWTFRAHGEHMRVQYARFFIVSIIGLGMSQFLLFIGVEIIRLHDLIAKLCIIIIVAFWNFFINKFWTFKV